MQITDHPCETPLFQHLVVADNRKLATEGMATITFCAGERCFQCDMFVVAIKEDRVLGLDFLCAQDYIMNNRRWSLIKERFLLP